MADLYAVAGAKFFIGNAAMAAPSDDVAAADFAAVTWVEVADWQTMGAIGDAAAEIATDLISRGRTVVQKGTRRSPAMQNVFAVNSSDAGQIALIAAEKTRSNYPFKIEFDDAPSGGTPTTEYFIGLVMSAQEQGGGANTARMLAATVAPNTNIVTVPAAVAP
jgi:hypothetical protein